MSETGVKFRELDLSDTSEVGLVYKSWLGSYKNHADVIPFDMYRAVYQVILDRLVKSDDNMVVLAVHPEHPEQIFGFACVSRSSAVLHYLYVKSKYRNKGIASDLLTFLTENKPFQFTFSTKLGRKYLLPRGGKPNQRIIR